jgi:8-oxoguanine deaminase
MSSKTQSIVWIKKPLAVYAENAEAGVVIQGEKILELVPQGQSP